MLNRGWYTLAVLLAILCTQTRGPLVARAWHAVESNYERWARSIADSRRGPLWKPVARLYDRARKARGRELAREGGPPGPSMAPGYVQRRDARWRQLHDAAMRVACDNCDVPALATFEGGNEGEPLNPVQDLPPDPLATGVPLPTDVEWNDWDAFLASTWASGPAAKADDMLWTPSELHPTALRPQSPLFPHITTEGPPEPWKLT